MGASFGELLNDKQEQDAQIIENFINNLRVATPAHIVDFDPEKQTATVQPAIKESINGDWKQLPQLLDVPVQFPQSGGYSLTFPVQPGDECLVVFSDMCIDSWWQSGDIQTQAEKRRHDLSDAMAILGFSSVPNAITKFSPDTVQLRNESGNTYFEINEEEINIVAKRLNINVQDTVDLRSPNTNYETLFNIQGNTSITGDTDITGKTAITGRTNINGAFSAGSGGGNAVIEGNITVKGSVTATESITTDSTFTGKEAVIDGITFTTHKHDEDTGKPLN